MKQYNVNESGIGISVSRSFRSYSFKDGYVQCIGSPSDIRKVCSVLERIGYVRSFTDAPIMREGRTYEVTFPAYWHAGVRYSVYRR